MSNAGKTINWATFCSSWIIRILFWGTSIFIVYEGARRNYSLTVLHVVFFTIGCAVLMVEATLVVTGDAILVTRLSKPGRVRLHWILHTLGLAAIIVGLVTIVVNKNRNGVPHIVSDHAIVGLTGFVVALVVGLAAIPTLHRKIVPEFINFGSFKRTHIYFGIIATILLWAGQITGFYTAWWTASDLITNLIIAAYAVGGFLLLARPLYSTLWSSFQ